ncbi:uncharacterized protein EI90DRAFT_3125804 [Cantharellus anzutake]|uniref:uncharacterized protein n=1 Tax=Cantharellus anzutake TaxID=1750568 RepID=UPI001905D413|nr:uncharacterized protein EI90DRAFT_3125804 [Cantharellus anzutake]KAF8328678.1 hypothetical protein EI90DRAFT_3125804 [Cantharellus anzutake]
MWHTITWQSHYSLHHFQAIDLLPEAILKWITLHEAWKTVADLQKVWLMAEIHGIKILNNLMEIDNQYDTEQHECKEAKKQETGMQNDKKQIEKQLEKRACEQEGAVHDTAMRSFSAIIFVLPQALNTGGGSTCTAYLDIVNTPPTKLLLNPASRISTIPTPPPHWPFVASPITLPSSSLVSVGPEWLRAEPLSPSPQTFSPNPHHHLPQILERHLAIPSLPPNSSGQTHSGPGSWAAADR